VSRRDERYFGSYTIEEELARLRRQIGELETELIDREAELVDLRTQVLAFQLEYDTRVGRKIEELEDLEAQVRHCKERISEYRQWGPGGPPRMRSGEPYIPVEEQYRRTWKEPVPPQPFPFVPPANPVAEAQIRKLYRQLCRRFHPDLTQDETERAWRTDRMAAINAAYGARSLTELRALAQTPDYASAQVSTDKQRLDALRETLQHIRRRLRQVKVEIHDLTHGQTMEMSLKVKLARQQGQDLLAEIAADVEKDLDRKRTELDFMMTQLKQLGIACE
jgi:predicted  nucleic acid-binding Zn-ribbon protein